MHVEDDILEKKEQAGFKAQAKHLERQLETEDTLIETVLRLVIQFTEEKTYDRTGPLVTSEMLENVNAAEITYLIYSLEDLRQAQSSVHTNRNKFANAFAYLLSNEVGAKGDFRRLITDEQDALEDVPENHMEIDEEIKEEESKQIMIDTSGQKD